MKNYAPTVSVMLDDRRAKENKLYPIKLRVTIKGERKYYPLGQDCSKEIWEAVVKPRGGSERVKELRILKSKIETYAVEIIQTLNPFTFNSFENQYLKKDINAIQVNEKSNDIFFLIRQYSDKLKAEGRISSGESYESLSSSLKRFCTSKKLIVSDITVEFLKSYEKWMLQCGRSDGKPQKYAGVGIYMRNLRYIVGQTVHSKLLDKDDYPFGKNKYQPPVGSNVKKALSINQLRAIQTCDLPEGSNIERSRDLYMFTYLCNGMNLKDICLLKWKDIEGSLLFFVRAKTKRTVKQQKIIRVTLNEISKDIINRWGTSNRIDEEYIFPFLKQGMTPTQVRYAVGTLCKRINSDMNTIAATLGIKANITTYTARHSYASQMLKNNAPIKMIEDGLGHTTLAFTESYLAELDEDTQREYVDKLL
jgi:integrase